VVALAISATGVDASELGVVARLLVVPAARRMGGGSLLLGAACAGARDLGLTPILDVVTRFHGAIALYEGAGWTQLGEVSVDLPDGTNVDEFVYLAPPSPT
jgi:GNAT superfamily N-acetyltransferase